MSDAPLTQPFHRSAPSRAALALLLVSVLILAGCASGAWTGRSVTDADARLMARVKVALVDDPSLAAAAIDVASRDGVVTLSGFVDSDAQRQRAREVAAAVTGVRRVDERLVRR